MAVTISSTCAELLPFLSHAIKFNFTTLHNPGGLQVENVCFVMQSEAEAWVFRTTEVLEAGGADAAQLRHSRQARKRMPTDARDSRHISDAGGLMVKNPRKSKEGGTPAPSTGGGGGGAAGPSKGGSEAANTANTDGKRSLLDAWRGEPSWRNPQGKKVNAAPKTESPERPQHAPLPANAVPGVEASVDFSEPPLPDPKVHDLPGKVPFALVFPLYLFVYTTVPQCTATYTAFTQ